MLSAGVERMYYYLAMDDGIFPYRGLVGAKDDARGSFRPHPVLVAYATLIRQLMGQSTIAGSALSLYLRLPLPTG